MKTSYLIFTGLLVFLFSCSSGEKQKIGDIYITDVKTKDTLFSVELVDLNQKVEIFELRKRPSYKVGVFNIKSRLASLSLVVPLDESSNLFQLNIPESFLKGIPLKSQKFISFGGSKMLSDYEKMLNDAKQNNNDTSLAVNGFIHDLYEFNKNYPGSGIVGYHIYEATVGGDSSEFSKHFSSKSKWEWQELSKSRSDIFSKELKRIKASGSNIGCKKNSPDMLLFQSSNSTIHPDLLKNNHKVIVFWATWCGPCKPQMKLLAELNKRKYTDLPVQFFAVSSENDEKVLFDWNEKNWNKYGYYLGFFHDKEHCMATNYEINQLPTIMVFNSKDKLIKKNCSVNEVEKILDSLLTK